ncbi:MAG: peptidoglycan editing factor PgeF [Candidatus Bruticola sp.]
MYKVISRHIESMPSRYMCINEFSPAYIDLLGRRPLQANLNIVKMEKERSETCDGEPEHWFDPFDLTYLTFPNINIPHAVSTRQGGVSSGAYCGLNIGFTTEDNPDDVEENRRRFHYASGVPLSAVLAMVHGIEVVKVDGPVNSLTLGDACITDKKGQPMMITTADCVPVVLYDPVHRAVGLAHAGWRGTVERIASVTVKSMASYFGSRPEDIQAGIGPSIGPCCFEVGQDVAQQFADSFADSPYRKDINLFGRRNEDIGCRVDLWLANLAALHEAGIKAENICLSNVCSVCQDSLCFSYRRDKRVTGRMASAVILP